VESLQHGALLNFFVVQEAAVKVCSFSKSDDGLGSEANVYYYVQGGPGIPRLL
jgi:hypothetical protein